MCVCKCKCVCVPSKPASKQETLCLLYLIWSHLMSASQQPALQSSYANGVFALFAKQFFVCAVQNDVKENTHTHKPTPNENGDFISILTRSLTRSLSFCLKSWRHSKAIFSQLCQAVCVCLLRPLGVLLIHHPPTSACLLCDATDLLLWKEEGERERANDDDDTNWIPWKDQ